MPRSGCCIQWATRLSETLEQVQENATDEADPRINGLQENVDEQVEPLASVS